MGLTQRVKKPNFFYSSEVVGVGVYSSEFVHQKQGGKRGETCAVYSDRVAKA